MQAFLQALSQSGMAAPVAPLQAAAPMVPLPPMAPMPPMPLPSVAAILPPAGGMAAQPPHLAAYPPPLNGVAPPALLAAALQPSSVSPQAHSHSISVSASSGTGNNTVLLGQPVNDAAIALLNSIPRPSSPETVPAIPKGVRHVDLGPSGKAPTTTAEFKQYLTLWWEDIMQAIRRPETFRIYEGFIRATMSIADRVDVKHALQYFAACQQANAKGWYSYDPPQYAQAFAEHVSPFLHASRGGGQSAQPYGKRSRFQRDADRAPSAYKAPTLPPAAQAPNALCHLPRHQGLDHTNAQCRTQHPELVAERPPKRQRPAAAAGSA